MTCNANVFLIFCCPLFYSLRNSNYQRTVTKIEWHLVYIITGDIRKSSGQNCSEKVLLHLSISKLSNTSSLHLCFWLIGMAVKRCKFY